MTKKRLIQLNLLRSARRDVINELHSLTNQYYCRDNTSQQKRSIMLKYNKGVDKLERLNRALVTLEGVNK